MNNRDRVVVTLNATVQGARAHPDYHGDQIDEAHFMPTDQNKADALDVYTYWSVTDTGLKFAYAPTEPGAQRRVVHYPWVSVLKYEVLASNPVPSGP